PRRTMFPYTTLFRSGRHDEVAKTGDEHNDGAGHDSGHGHGKNQTPERLQPVGAEIKRRFRHGHVELFDTGIQGQEHERNEYVNHADHHRKVGEYHFQWLVDDAKPHQGLIDETRGPEQQYPGKEPDDQADKKWQRDQEHVQVLAPGRLAADPEGRGITDDQTQEHRADGQPDRTEKHPQINRVKRFITRIGPAKYTPVIEVIEHPLHAAVQTWLQPAV